jgi:predicted transcriptional regulator
LNQSILEMTKDLVKSQIEHHGLAPEIMQRTLQETYASLLSLKAQEDHMEAGELDFSQEARNTSAPTNWKKSITKHAITCLECGQSFKQLSLRHLSQHDMTPRSYREKYGIPRAQPLSAKATTARRREIAQEIKPWELTPRAKAAKKTVRRTRKKAATATSQT